MTLQRYYNFKPFTEMEAWTLFRLAAFGEALGWTLLITGIILSHFLHTNLPVLIAGQFHGILFLIYFAAAALTAPSLSWRPRRIITAIVCGVPPYGSLLFELWQSHRQNRDRLKITLGNSYLTQLTTSES
ncbi:MAG TPA: DUF3817 domain-containing protein [Candidatus Saccharimonadales bacterium]|nr:DUF3817 domain-containing protein [Candidatus Saccharimonadales bacterium]